MKEPSSQLAIKTWSSMTSTLFEVEKQLQRHVELVKALQEVSLICKIELETEKVVVDYLNDSKMSAQLVLHFKGTDKGYSFQADIDL